MLDRKKNKDKPMTRHVRLHCEESDQDYMMLLEWRPNRSSNKDHEQYFAIVNDDNGHPMYVVISMFSVELGQIPAYTQHFLMRYAERTHLPEGLDLDDILMEFINSNSVMAALYYDEKKLRSVHATPKGVVLSVEIPDSPWRINKTFISVDMLKPSQREAYRAVLHILDQRLNIAARCSSDEEALCELMENSSSVRTDLQEAFDIYGEYFNS